MTSAAPTATAATPKAPVWGEEIQHALAACGLAHEQASLGAVEVETKVVRRVDADLEPPDHVRWQSGGEAPRRLGRRGFGGRHELIGAIRGGARLRDEGDGWGRCSAWGWRRGRSGQAVSLRLFGAARGAGAACAAGVVEAATTSGPKRSTISPGSPSATPADSRTQSVPPAWPSSRFARADNSRRRASEQGLPFTWPELAEKSRSSPAGRPSGEWAAQRRPGTCLAVGASREDRPHRLSSDL